MLRQLRVGVSQRALSLFVDRGDLRRPDDRFVVVHFAMLLHFLGDLCQFPS